MPGYTKLFSSIIASTIWRAPNETRLVWITMLAMSDRHGMVEGSVPGLADLARVTVEQCRAALLELQSPDPDSRSTECEGRRIQAVDGGWHIVNHGKFRAKMSLDDRREYLRLKQAEHRARRKNVNTASTAVNKRSGCKHNAEADPDPKAERSKPLAQTTRKAARSRSLSPSADFLEFWFHYPRKDGKQKAWQAWTKASPDLPVVLAALAWQTTSRQWTKDGGEFIPLPASYLNGRRWEDEPFHQTRHSIAPTFRPDSVPTLTRETWYADCQAKHGGTCGTWRDHDHQLDRDAAKTSQDDLGATNGRSDEKTDAPKPSGAQGRRQAV